MQEVQGEEMNLNNVSKQNNHKTKNVIEYIQKLELENYGDLKHLSKFSNIKKNALMKTTANEMLKTIGYNPIKTDGIYSEAVE